jgi:hypothetical protein
MKFYLAILLTITLSFLAGLFLPWWSIAIISFAVAAFLPQSIGKSFLSGFLGILILWGLLAAWIDMKNESILSLKIAELMELGRNSFLLILITSLIGAMVGGFAAMAGASLRPYPSKRK